MSNQKSEARPITYAINKDDIEGMMRSGVPNETVVAKVDTYNVEGKPLLGWLIEVSRPLYGEEYVMSSFVSLALVSAGPEWVEEQHRIIDAGFEAARKEHPKAMH